MSNLCPMDLPTTAEELRDWFRELKDASGLSFRAIAEAIGEEERNVKRWMTVDATPSIPSGDIVLRLITALGVTITPPPPASARGLNSLVWELRATLGEVDSLLDTARRVAARLALQQVGESAEELEALAAQVRAREESPPLSEIA